MRLIRVDDSFGQPPVRDGDGHGAAALLALPHPPAEMLLPLGLDPPVVGPRHGHPQDVDPIGHAGGEANRGWREAGRVRRARLRITLLQVRRAGAGKLILRVPLHRHAAGCQPAEDVAVERVLAGRELLLWTTQRAQQVCQHQPLQLIPDYSLVADR